MKITVKETVTTEKEIEFKLPLYLKYKDSRTLMLKVVSENEVVSVSHYPSRNDSTITLVYVAATYLGDSDFKPATKKEFNALYHEALNKITKLI